MVATLTKLESTWRLVVCDDNGVITDVVECKKKRRAKRFARWFGIQQNVTKVR